MLCILQAGLKARHNALMAALEDMDTWLGEGQSLSLAGKAFEHMHILCCWQPLQGS